MLLAPSLEIAVRVGGSALVFATLMLWEWFAPRRKLTVGRRPRWPGNLGIWAVDIVAVRLLVPTAAVGVALIAGSRGWGLLHLIGLPTQGWGSWVAIVAGVIALDLVIYIQHVIFHHVPVLWRLHRMHHADLDIDVTTGVRFHPFEILLSLAIKIAAVTVLGVPALAVLIFEVLLNASSMFNHSNIALPLWLEPIARWIIVTPQMHQVHHSIERAETNSNFGFNLSWWDRLFGTYRDKPAVGEEGMTIGLPIFRGLGELQIGRLLTQPFRDDGHHEQ